MPENYQTVSEGVFSELRLEGVLRSPAWIILTTHPCSSSRPMAQPLLAGTFSIVQLQRKSDS